MTKLEVWEWIYQFVSKGGPVIVIIFAVGAWAWVLLLDRLLLFPRFMRLRGKYRATVQSTESKDTAGVRLLLEEQRFNYHILMNKHQRTIAKLAVLAPLLGLLGTVSGMTHTFETITRFGFGNPVLLAEGISEALLTTEAGLLVAFPVVICANLLRHGLINLEQKAWHLALAEVNHGI